MNIQYISPLIWLGVNDMTRYFARIEVDRILFLKVKRRAKNLLTVGGRLYPNDDYLYIKDYLSADAIRFNRIESSQPITCRGDYVDPDSTRIKILYGKLTGNKKKLWLNMDASNLWKYLVGIIIAGSIIYGMLTGGNVL